LIASKESITLSGRIHANSIFQGAWGGGSGAIRLIANRIAGSGELNVAGNANPGRIRVETPTYLGNLAMFPPTLVVPPDSPPLIWPRTNSAEARVVSVAGKPAPLDPRANLSPGSVDISIQDDQLVEIVIETKNLDVENSTVTARVTPRIGGAFIVPASYSSGNTAQATWIATTKIPQGFAAIQARGVGK
jgi:hypothetical protein